MCTITLSRYLAKKVRNVQDFKVKLLDDDRHYEAKYTFNYMDLSRGDLIGHVVKYGPGDESFVLSRIVEIKINFKINTIICVYSIPIIRTCVLSDNPDVVIQSFKLLYKDIHCVFEY